MEKVDSYSVIELETQKDEMRLRIQSIELKLENKFYLPDPGLKGIWADPTDFEPRFKRLLDQKEHIRGMQ